VPERVRLKSVAADDWKQVLGSEPIVWEHFGRHRLPVDCLAGIRADIGIDFPGSQDTLEEVRRAKGSAPRERERERESDILFLLAFSNVLRCMF